MMHNSVDVLVTGAEERQGLAVVRSLGAHGVTVCAAGARAPNMGFLSRYTQARCLYPSPLTDKIAFCREILRAVQKYNIAVVMPVVESTVIALDEHRDLFTPHTRLALPPAQALEYALDKQKTYQLAESLGIAIPRTCYPASRAEAMDFAQQAGFPLIAKPRAYGSYGKSGAAFDFKVLYLRDMQALKAAISKFERLGAFPMLQQYCPGISVPQNTLCASGQIIGICQHRRGRDYPLSGGVASVVISEPVDPQLRAWTEKLLEALQWDGVAQVEYRLDRRTGRKTLFEINGRLWAPVSAAIQWGLNFPHALYRYVRFGEAAPMPADYPLEKHCRYLRGDLIALEGYILGVNDHSVTQLPGKLKTAWDIVKDFRPAVQSDVWSWRDPLPSCYEYIKLAGRYTLGSAYRLSRHAAHRLLQRKKSAATREKLSN